MNMNISPDKIIHGIDTPENVLEWEGAYIWTSKDAEVTYVWLDVTKQQAQLLICINPMSICGISHFWLRMAGLCPF